MTLEKSCIVYWIHLPEHTDIFSEGYVGITTKSLEKRFQQHRYQARKGGLHLINKVVRKYEEQLVVDTKIVSTLDYCLDIENKLRPEPFIGWNSSAGGKWVGKSDYRTPEEVREKISESVKRTHQERPWLADNHSKNMKGRTWTDERRLAKSVATKGNGADWENARADKSTWLRAEEIFNLFHHNAVKTQKELSDLSCIPYPKLKRIFIKLKSNWNPLEDQKWLDFKNTFQEGNI